MIQSSSTHQIRKSQEISAVYRLLEVAEKKNIAEDHWYHNEQKNHERASNLSLPIDRKKNKEKSKSKEKEKKIGELLTHDISRKQKHIDKQRLQQLIHNIDNEEDIDSPLLMQKKKQLEKNSDEMAMTMRFLKNAKLRPFNSNMTFYSTKKDQKRRYLNSSLAFHKSQAKDKSMQNLNINHEYRVIGADQVEHQQLFMRREVQSSNQLVYFNSNKSQTVRELLNHMKEQRTKNRQIFLNATDRQYQQVPETEPQFCIFNEHQLRMMNRYRRFIPFQKDESLLLRKMLDGENIWLKRYKDSWLRRKSEKDGKKSYFKRLIVKN